MEPTYGIECLNISEAQNNSDEFKWLFAQRRIVHMANNKNNNKGITHECNVLSYILNPIKWAKTKNCHYSPILQICMNIHSGGGGNRSFRILSDSGISTTIVMGKMTSKLKQKKHQKKICGKTKQGSSRPHRRWTKISVCQNLVQLK